MLCCDGIAKRGMLFLLPFEQYCYRCAFGTAHYVQATVQGLQLIEQATDGINLVTAGRALGSIGG